MKKYIHILLSLLFPTPAGVIDFSVVSSEEILQRSPRANVLSESQFPSHCQAILSYKYPRTRALVWQIKYKRDVTAIRHGGYVLYQTLIKKYPVEKIIVVPMPVSPARRRERGYNQCELLAAVLTAQQLKENNPQIEIRTDILFRSTHTERQTLKSRTARLEGARGIFSVDRKIKQENVEFKNQPLVVIDDVITTGSTLREAVVTLEKAGFTNVSSLALAH